MRRALKWSLGGDVVSRVLLLLTTLAAARALGPHGFAAFATLLAIALFAGFVWDFGLSTFLTREIAASDAAPSSVIRPVVRARLILLPAWIATFFGGAALTGTLDVAAIVLVMFSVNSLLVTSHGLVIAILRGQLRFRAVATALTTGRLCAATGVVALAAADRASLTKVAFALALGELVTLVIALVLIGARTRAPGHRPTPIEVRLRSVAPYAANGLLSIAYNRLDVVLIAALSTTSAVAAYAPASRIQDALFVLPSALGSVALPSLARLLRERRTSHSLTVMKFIAVGLVAGVPTATAAFLAMPTLIRFALGAEFLSATTPARILVWFLPMSAVSSILIANLVALGRAAATMPIFVAAFVAAMSLHLCLDWWWGATGAAVASLTREPVALVVAVLITLKVRRQAA